MVLYEYVAAVVREAASAWAACRPALSYAYVEARTHPSATTADRPRCSRATMAPPPVCSVQTFFGVIGIGGGDGRGFKLEVRC
jgi:hypothetical protein